MYNNASYVPMSKFNLLEFKCNLYLFHYNLTKLL